MLAGSVNAQTSTGTITGKLKLVWEHSMSTYTTSVTRSIGQLGKQALVPNIKNGTIEVWDATGKVKEYNVNQWLIDNKTDVNPDDSEVYTMGHGVSTDEAGNIIVNLQFPGVESSKLFVAIKPDGTMTYIPCEFPSALGATNGRMDHLGDKSAGDVFNNGYIVACPNLLQYAVVYNIYEGEQDKEFSYGVKIGADENTEAWNTESTAIFLEPFSSKAGHAPKFIARNRSLGGYRLSADGESALQKITLPDKTMLGFGGATTSNFSAFTVKGESYVVGNQPDPNDGNARTHYWEIKKVSTGETVATWSAPTGERKDDYMVGFASSVNEDGSVNIYQFNPGIRLAKYTLAAEVTGINNVITDADENAPVEYYNLQGVKVEKPENGIFIKKQGAKATKIIAE